MPVVVDACGGISPRTEDAALRPLVQASVVTTSIVSIAGQLAGIPASRSERDDARALSDDVRLDVALNQHVGACFAVPNSPMHCVIKGSAAVLESLPERQHLLIEPN